MENFTVYNPVKLHFGRGIIEGLGKSVSKYGKKVLLIYGGGSIKKNGIYEKVLEQLNGIGAEVYEYSGIRSNPVIEDVDAAASLGRQKEIDMILAVGGGSVIDSAKVISVAIPADESAWKFMTGEEVPRKAIPLIDVLTLAATGTEMNALAVVQNNQTKEKRPIRSSLIYPKESFLDPEFTFTVNKAYTAYGIVDLIAHSLEAFFGEGDASLSDRFVFSIINEAMENGTLLIENLQNYTLRESIMYAATNALNSLTLYGRKSGEWGVHSLGHILSLLYDVPHGASLSIIYPAWLKYFKDQIKDRISLLGENIFHVSGIDETIFKLEAFFTSLDSPVRLSEIGIGIDKYEEILTTMMNNKVEGNRFGLDHDVCKVIIELCA